MSKLWSRIEEGSIEIVHHSTSSNIEIIFSSEEPTQEGGSEIVKHHLWLDYGGMDDLVKAVQTWEGEKYNG